MGLQLGYRAVHQAGDAKRIQVVLAEMEQPHSHEGAVAHQHQITVRGCLGEAMQHRREPGKRLAERLSTGMSRGAVTRTPALRDVVA